MSRLRSSVVLLCCLVACGGSVDSSVSTPSELEAARASCDGGASDCATANASGGGLAAVKNVFVILMENHNWSQIRGSASAPYINQTLLPLASHAERYQNVPHLHPSEPNYIWLEAGDNLGIKNDKPPAANHRATTAHLSAQLDAAGISWRAYAEGIDGVTCPLVNRGLYAPKHVPFVFFDDVTDGNSVTSATCIAHVRPSTELGPDLEAGRTARYNFITPDLCHDMHNSSGCATGDAVGNGDAWLAEAVPKILASSAYRDNGALFITWDESEGGDFPIGLITLSPLAKGHGYANQVPYSHSSLLRTVQTIFAVTPFLGGARDATDLGDLFSN